MRTGKGYSVLLDSRGVALLQQRVGDAELEALRQLTGHLTSINFMGGSDDRREIKDAPPAARELAKSVALLCDAPSLVEQANGLFELQTVPTGLLSNQIFSEQPSVPKGFTGFLVGEDLLLTTAHEVQVPSLRIVFDFMLDSNNVPKTTYSADEVFTADKIDGRQNTDTGEDWLLLRLDHRPNRPFQRIESQAARLGDPLWMLGHPLGLPMKFVDNATVTKADNVVFECDLDASQGNSGSGVVTPQGNVVGLLQGTAPAVDRGLWLWCPVNSHCPTFVTSSPTFAAIVAANLGP